MRLIIVSNRLPFTLVKEEDKLLLKPSSGGLVSGISSYLDFMKNSPVSDFEYLWIGWPGGFVEEPLQKNFSQEIVKIHNAVCVFLTEEKMDKFYLGFCNSTIWPLFHYFPTYTTYESEYWEIYKEVNKIFCDKICEVAKEEDIIWIHDYHLMLLPQMLREKLGNKTKIGFFLHIPFPSFEIYRTLPKRWREEILKGVLGADLIGFHTNEYTHAFLRSVLRILGIPHILGKLEYENRVIKVDTFPMGIDFYKFFNASNEEKVIKEALRIKEELKQLKIILSVDRLDYTKGVPNRLLAFKKFLTDNPQYRKKVVFVLIIVPSRIGVQQYQLMKNNLDKLISDINGQFGDIGWQPIVYQYRHIPFENLVSLYSAADICLITPLRDGMNLVAKEYIASQSQEYGVLILSEMAGASKELPEAIIVNPNDIEEIADAIKIAIETEPETKKSNILSMQNRLREYNVVEWAKDFLLSLQKIKEESKKKEIKIISLEDKSKIIKDYQKAKKRLIMLDYDGTLVPFFNKPQKAKPDKELIEILKKLADSSEVSILSGRDSNFLSEIFGDLNINLSAEHGALIKEKNSTWQVITHSDTLWKEQIYGIFKHYCNRLPGSFIEEKSFSLVLHYRNSDPELAEIRVKEFLDELINYTSNLNLQILQGSKVVEVRNYDINKANAGMYFISKDNYDFILFIGDDWTDEDLFNLLKDKNAYTIKVGMKNSAAKYNISSVRDVRNFLKEMIYA